MACHVCGQETASNAERCSGCGTPLSLGVKGGGRGGTRSEVGVEKSPLLSGALTLVFLILVGFGVEHYLATSGSDAELYAYNGSSKDLSLTLTHAGSQPPQVVQLSAGEGTTFKLTSPGAYTLASPGQPDRVIQAPSKRERSLRELHVYGNDELGFILEPHFLFPAGTAVASMDEKREELSQSYASAPVSTAEGKADLSLQQVDSAFAGKPTSGRAVAGQTYVVAWELRADP